MKVILQQQTPEWHRWRENKITASEVSSVVGLNPWCSRNKLWKRKLGIITQESTNFNMVRGISLEPIARTLVEERLGRPFAPACFQHDKLEWAGASLDGIDDSGITIIEIKCPRQMDQKVPEHYMPQMQFQMFCSGASKCYYCCYVGGDLEMFLVERDEAYIKWLVEECEKFLLEWKNLEEPDLDISDCEEVNEPEALITKCDFDHADNQAKYWAKIREEKRRDLIGIADGRNVRIDDLVVSKYTMPGSISYDRIPELKTVDLSFFRKDPVTTWRLTRKRK